MFFTMIMNKSIYLRIALIMLSLAFFGCTDETNHSQELNEKMKVALRDAGNRLLLQHKDSTSLVLPIIELEKLKYKISFEKELGIKPSELVVIVNESIEKIHLEQNYTLEVLQCEDEQVAYSYNMTMNEKTTIIPCMGRWLPEACYTFQIRFLQDESTQFTSQKLMYVWLLTVLIGLLFLYRKKRKAIPPSENKEQYVTIGSFKFYSKQNTLIKEAKEIGLSRKECEILEIFVANMNQVVRRDEFIKKVWEDNGVFVGRSLDTYISKLRKKLVEDETIKLTNIHGIGYKLEVFR